MKLLQSLESTRVIHYVDLTELDDAYRAPPREGQEKGDPLLVHYHVNLPRDHKKVHWEIVKDRDTIVREVENGGDGLTAEERKAMPADELEQLTREKAAELEARLAGVMERNSEWWSKVLMEKEGNTYRYYEPAEIEQLIEADPALWQWLMSTVHGRIAAFELGITRKNRDTPTAG